MKVNKNSLSTKLTKCFFFLDSQTVHLPVEALIKSSNKKIFDFFKYDGKYDNILKNSK